MKRLITEDISDSGNKRLRGCSPGGGDWVMATPTHTKAVPREWATCSAANRVARHGVVHQTGSDTEVCMTAHEGGSARRVEGRTLLLFWKQPEAAFCWNKNVVHSLQLPAWGWNLMEASQIPHTDIYFQTDLMMTERAAQGTSGSCSRAWRQRCQVYKCARLDEFIEHVTMLREELMKQHSIQESKQVIDMWYCAPT